VQAFGGIVLASGESDWHIERSVQKYMWECMRYFIATGVALRMANSWDMRAWFERLERTSPTIVARNVDILAAVVKADTTPVQLEFEICRGGISDLTAQAYDLPMSMLTLTDGQSVKLAPADTFLEFVAPNTVSVTSEAPHELNLGPSEVYIKAECSLISTGTELKIFKGEFESGEALDTTIEAMKDQTLKYPLRYGYSVVGRVVAVGEDVDSSVTGSRVFCFAPHGTGSVASIDSCVHIPDEISSQDAVFLPSVETALSIVQDAQPKLGEVVAVFGQGLIGLLVGSILQRQMLRSEACSDQLVLVDVNDARLAVARDAIPQATYWNPSKDLPLTKEFDVSIEVSGSPKALQTALDSTGYGGRVVVGSWYGARPAALSLGLQLHRSHLTIIMSQVSRVAAVHSDRWDKARRMTLALDMLRQLKPSEWLLGRKIPLTKAALQKAYSDLSAGKELTILIEYS
jgi:2-desacetyl-2-hydroxyethyl bacteriochlorophyllide A dehydrogenase